MSPGENAPAPPPPESPEPSHPVDSPPGALARARAFVETAQARVVTTRRTVPSVDAAFTAHGRDLAVGGNLLASAIAYRLFLWMLPLALLGTSFLGFVRAADEEDPAHLADDLGLSAYVASTVARAAEQAESSRWLVLVIGLWALYVASAAGAKTFSAVHGLVWGLSVRRPRKTARAGAAFTGFGVLALLVTFGAYWARREAPSIGLGVTLAIFVAYAALWLAIALFLPHADAPWTRLIPGALFAAFGAQVLHLATVFYLASKLEHASELYGGLGAAAGVLLWLYLLGRLAVGSAVINATLWERTGASRVHPAGVNPLGPDASVTVDAPGRGEV